ncbi:MAG: hypothetical protein ACM30G_01480 [Micromonosporaceae bacterium]
MEQTISYDRMTFRVPGDAESPMAQYHQQGDLVWADFAGGHVRRGSVVGTCAPDGVLRLTYCMVLESGEIISGRSHSTPDRLEDGRILLTERWERYGPHAATGVSYLEQVGNTDGEQ